MNEGKEAVRVDCSLSLLVLFCKVHECFCIVERLLCAHLGTGARQFQFWLSYFLTPGSLWS